jgi:putative ABC transport system permease protein
MSAISYKVWGDLWAYKARTLQVVLIIAMGAFALGMIITTRNLIIGGMQEIWQASAPAMLVLWADPRIDDETITALQGIKGVTEVEGYIDTMIEWRRHATEPWQAGQIIARNDYENQHYAKVSLLSGTWPKEKRVAIGQGTDTEYGIGTGEPIEIRINDRAHWVKIEGVIYDPSIQPPSFGGPVQFFASREWLGEVSGEPNFNRILAGAPVYDHVKLTAIADQMKRKLEKQGVDSGGAGPPEGNRVVDPNKHFFQDAMDGIFFVLGVMAVLALILGLFLVYNTINAIINLWC